MKQTIPFTKDITFKSKIGELTSISLDNDLTLKGEDLITGNFYISGTYKMMDTVLNPEKYSYKIPVEISISDEYDTYDSTIDIDDFEYEVIEDDILRVNIVVVIDNLVKKELEEKEDLILEDFKDDILEDLDEREDIKEETTKKEDEEPQEEIKQEKIDERKEDEEIKEEHKKEPEKVIEHKKEPEEKLMDLDEISEEIKRDIKVENTTNAFLDKKEKLKKEEDSYLTYSVYIVKDGDTVGSIKEKYKVTD